MPRTRTILLLVALALTFAGCGGGGGGGGIYALPGGAPPARLVSLALTPDETLWLGTNRQLTATGTYSDNSTRDLTSEVTWSSADEEVVSATAEGVAIPLGKGSTTVTATHPATTLSAQLPVAVGMPAQVSTNGHVLALARLADGTTLLGGYFTWLGQALGPALPLDRTSGTPTPGYPVANGFVRAAVSDGSGGWFLGGEFTEIGGEARNRLAHVLADGTVSAWNPGANQAVRTLVLSGNTLYAGGDFTSLGNGSPSRRRLGALDATTGDALAWNPGAGGPVQALALQGATLFVGGDFTRLGGQTRYGIGAVDSGTGAATAWNPEADDVVNCLALSPDGTTLYAGGDFRYVGGTSRSYLAGLSTADGSLTAWNPRADSGVRCLAVGPDGTVYAGGAFTTVGGVARNRIAALDAATGAPTAWDPNSDAELAGLAVSADGTTVYAGGSFGSIGGAVRGGVTGLDAATGAATAFGAGLASQTLVLAVSGDTAFVGGTGILGNAQPRSHLAAVDASGTVTPWNPAVTPAAQYRSVVYSLAVSPDSRTVYVGGGFSGIGATPAARKNLAALDLATGEVLPWSPEPDSPVLSLQLSADGSLLYAGGGFTSIGTTPAARNNLAALDTTTGEAKAWNPSPNGGVYCLGLSPDEKTVFACGLFSGLGVTPVPRSFVAGVDTATGEATPWAPNPDARPQSLAFAGDTLYLGGDFTTFDGQPRSHAASVDLTTGALSSWSPNVVGAVYSLAPAPETGTIYLGGNFLTVGGEARVGIAEVHTTGPAAGTPTDWNPGRGASAGIAALVLTRTTLQAGGTFSTLGTYSPNFAWTAR